MIMDELIGDDEWRSEWTECKVTTLGKRARKKSSKQKQPEARRKRARKERRGATTAAERRKNNKGMCSLIAIHCCSLLYSRLIHVGASGYQPVRTLEAGTAKETKEKKQRRTQEQLKQQWDRGERDGLHQCPKCMKIMTSRPDDTHFKTKTCQNNTII